MFHNHFAVHGKWTTWQDISNCRIRKDWKRSCSSHAILWCDGKRTWRFEVRVLYRVLLWEAVWPNGCTSSWNRVIILNSIFLFLFLSFFFLVFIFSNFQSNQNEPSDNISNWPSRQVMRMNEWPDQPTGGIFIIKWLTRAEGKSTILHRIQERINQLF